MQTNDVRIAIAVAQAKRANLSSAEATETIWYTLHPESDRSIGVLAALRYLEKKGMK